MKYFATCAKGTEGALRRELSALRLHAVRGEQGGVSFEGKLEAGLAACLHSRVAMRVLLELARFPAGDAASLYDGARAVDWSAWLTTRTTLAVESTLRDSGLTHSGYAALKVKDAVVDALRDKLGARPDVDPKDPDVRIVLHVAGDEATLSLDLAGEPLHRRGYRSGMTPAPLKETLAAAVLALGGVDRERPFIDPMCGSGTLAIEHALAARRIAPGLGRPFGFQRWPAYRGALQSTWDRMKEEARRAALPAAPAPIVARDLFTKALDAARKNAAAAGVLADLRFERGDVRDLAPEPGMAPGTLCMNPPYGERLMGKPGDEERGRAGGAPRGARPGAGRRGGREEPPAFDRRAAHVSQLKLEGLYRGMAEALGRFHGWSAVLLSGNPHLDAAMGRAEVRHRLWNGPLEVRLLRYRLR
ncbi:THUMP domain-containing class I SAM-dependent RNA methyltransferase [Anaeromyxobacter diazotrophicus]|uniref:RNA methyltransferase n=1 Tax=Anaeromyxobacter diazotrophicus TaxID=2590199 RepID=A0A7I9VIJ5_9BACT|nr:THUMP domain-containing protein [Anaeromyxobacter diazotrophicus]GEJ55837.1 RNA methyltransferase [Anaeromyxobacter diazotrophicus]